MGYLLEDIWGIVIDYLVGDKKYHRSIYNDMLDEFKYCGHIFEDVFWIDIIELKDPYYPLREMHTPYYSIFKKVIEAMHYKDKTWSTNDDIYNNHDIEWEKYNTKDIANFRILLK